MKYISLEYILKLHQNITNDTDGSSGIRDIELLKSSIENCKTTFYGEDLYPQLE